MAVRLLEEVHRSPALLLTPIGRSWEVNDYRVLITCDSRSGGVAPLVLLLQEVGRHADFRGYPTVPTVAEEFRDPMGSYDPVTPEPYVFAFGVW